MRRQTTYRTVATLGVLAILSAPHETSPQTCATSAARGLLNGPLTDGILNPPDGEDQELFTSKSDFPNVFLLMDTSGSMSRLPPNGPAFLLGETADLPAAGVVGCGSETEFGGLASNPMLDVVASRTYHSPCGSTAYDNLPYRGHPGQPGGVDYAQAGKSCSYFSTATNQLEYAAGYDPDYYDSSNALTTPLGRPNLFPKDLVFHDNITDGKSWAYSSSERLGAQAPKSDKMTPDKTKDPYGNGWDFGAIYPWRSDANTIGTIAGFCGIFATQRQNGITGDKICSSCLQKKGWFYDGHNFKMSQDNTTDAPFPSLWYTGNYLSFFPPKFVIARRVVKDVIATQTRVRMALAGFVDKTYKLVKRFSPLCEDVLKGQEAGTWESYRSDFVSAVNGLDWGSTTPAAHALYDVGRYYRSADLPWFNDQTADETNKEPAICWKCQPSSAVLITDGVPSKGDGNDLAPGSSSIAEGNATKKTNTGATTTATYAGNGNTGILQPDKTDCPECYAFTGTNDFLNNLARVAFYLHNYDLRKDDETTKDCAGMAEKQVVDTYTVGFATSKLANAASVLQNAAHAGGGLFFSAESADQLKASISRVFTAVSTRSTSVSAASVASLQTSGQNGVIVSRFEPSRTAFWPGHLYRYDLYSEFANGCTPGGTGDYDCDGTCSGIFLVDRAGDFIAEDGTGRFVKTGTSPACDLVPRCKSSGKCATVTAASQPAEPYWDAATASTAVHWSARSVWTVVDDAEPKGTLDADDSMVRLEPTDAAADKLRPYLGLGRAGGACESIAARISTAGDLVTSERVAKDRRECAKTIIRYVLGADVFNEARRTTAQGWPPPATDPSKPTSAGNPPDQDQLKNRTSMLGDIFHSSPVIVEPPAPADGILGPAGLVNQTLPSLWLTPTRPATAGTNPYNQYAHSSAYQDRRKTALVGANDGMLHAFDAGSWTGHEYGVGTGAELWAFVPPDLLGKLWLLTQNQHQLFVDGSAMVRDVWVDGAGNSLASPALLDDLKSPSEFHTVAVVGERRGGNRYFALDVTDATRTTAENGGERVRPKFLWLYPQPSDAGSLRFGETYTDFLPQPPPIGPVRIKADANSGRVADANTPTYAVPGAATPVPYHERWVVVLPGGFDPQYLRGRGVHMVDVWTGKEVLDFSYTPTASSGDPRLGLTFPVAAVPGLLMWGKGATREVAASALVNDGFFDTATFGDTGGQLWVLRFNTPGEMDASGRVGNWFGGRVFQMGQTACNGSVCSGAGGQPFFYVTANAQMPGSSYLRVFAGTGDRFNLLDLDGGTCGPDNVRACAQRGCSVTLEAAKNYSSVTGVGSDARGLAQSACSLASQPAFTSTSDLTGATPTCGTQAAASIAVASCPGSVGANAFTKDVAVSCETDADGDYGCRTGTTASPSSGVPNPGFALDLTPSWASYPQARNWFFGLRVFDQSGDRAVFADKDGAAAYDAARYSLEDRVTSLNTLQAPTASSGITVIDGGLDNPTSLSTPDAAGWALYYRHGSTVAAGAKTYNVNLLDERTVTGSALWGLLTWNTFQPPLGEASAATCTYKSKCAGSFRRVAYHYGANPATGGTVLVDTSGTVRRSTATEAQAPPQGDAPTVTVNKKGELQASLTAVNPESGVSNVPVSGALEPLQWLGSRAIPRDVHECRHFKPEGGLTQAERAEVLKKCR